MGDWGDIKSYPHLGIVGGAEKRDNGGADCEYLRIIICVDILRLLEVRFDEGDGTQPVSVVVAHTQALSSERIFILSNIYGEVSDG